MYSKSRSINSKINSAPVNFPAPESNTSLNLSSFESNSPTTKNSCCTTTDDKVFYEKDITYSSANYDSHSDSSWSDDLENQSTKVIKYEYGLVEKLLYQEESFNVYNEEFDQWCENFQHLRIVGNAIKCPHPSMILKAEYTEDIIEEHKDEEALVTTVNEAKNQVKMAVIEKILESIYSKRTSSDRKPKKVNKSTQPETSRSNPNSRTNTRQRRKNKSFLPVRKKPLVGVTPVTSLLKDPIMTSHMNSAKWTKNNDYYELDSLPVLHNKTQHDKDFRPYQTNQSASKMKKVTFNTDNNVSASSSITTSKFDIQKHLNNARFIKTSSPSSSCLNFIHLPPIELHNKTTRPKSQIEKTRQFSGYNTPKNLSRVPSDYSNVSSNFTPNVRSLSKSNVTIFKVLKSPKYVQYI